MINKKNLIAGLGFLLGSNIFAVFNKHDQSDFLMILNKLEKAEKSNFSVHSSTLDSNEEEEIFISSLDQIYDFANSYYDRLNEAEFRDEEGYINNTFKNKQFCKSLLCKLRIFSNCSFRYKEFQLNHFRRLLDSALFLKCFDDKDFFDLVKLKLINLFSIYRINQLVSPVDFIRYMIIRKNPNFLLGKYSVEVEFNEIIESLIELLQGSSRRLLLESKIVRKKLLFDE
jgi:hypothetical protein